VNWYYKGCIGISKIDKFALFWSKLYLLYSSLLATDLLGALKVLVSYLYISAKYKKVQVISKADYNKASIVIELGIETNSIEEEENRRKQ
jgi:hypothetical protein